MNRSRSPRVFGAGVLVGAALLLGACGSTGASLAQGSLNSSCKAVAAVLSEGPGPTEDPVGYAEAQILPLQKVHASNKTLRIDIQRLDRAYKAVFDSNDSPSAARAEKNASARLDALCPKAVP